MSLDLFSLTQAPPLTGPVSDSYRINVIADGRIYNAEIPDLRAAILGDFEQRVAQMIQEALPSDATILDPVQFVATNHIWGRSGLMYIDGEYLFDGDHVLLTSQETPAQNGVWVVKEEGPWVRRDDMLSPSYSYGVYVRVEGGDEWTNTWWQVSGGDGTISGTITTDVDDQHWNLTDEPNGGTDNEPRVQWSEIGYGLSNIGDGFNRLAIDTEIVPQLGTSNEFTESQVITSIADAMTINNGDYLRSLTIRRLAEGDTDVTIPAERALGGVSAESVVNESALGPSAAIDFVTSEDHGEQGGRGTEVILSSTANGSTEMKARWAVAHDGTLKPLYDGEFTPGIGTIDNPVAWMHLTNLLLSGQIRSTSQIVFSDGNEGYQSIAVQDLVAEGNIRLARENGIGVRFYGSDEISVSASAADDPNHGGRVTGETESTTNVYYRSNETENDGHVFQAGGENVLGIHADGVRSEVAITAPSFDGNATTATKLATAVTINGVEFDGSQNIEIPGNEPDGADKNFTHIQDVPSDTWSIQHGMDKYPAVVILDEEKYQVQGMIQYPDRNTVVISFTVPMVGEASLN